MFSGLTESYKRWRHTRGYGVHSPFAYSLVCNVLKPKVPYAYYGYEDIDNAVERGESRRNRREARILLRLAARLGVRSAFIPQHSVNTFRVALLAADSRMHISTAMSEIPDCTLIGSNSDYVPLDVLKHTLTRPGSILALRKLPAGWIDELFETLDEGLMLFGRDNAIIISRPGMQKVAYSIRL